MDTKYRNTFQSTSLAFNGRASDIFAAILSSGINFNGASILDLGCGYGDLLLMATHHGATRVVGVDTNKENLGICHQKMLKYAPAGTEWELLPFDMDNRSDLANLGYYDIAFCTSVLPYLDNMSMALSFMATRARSSFVEMQYHGDGPGLSSVQSDDDMEKLLRKHWTKVRKIGETFTGRQPHSHRSIWQCTIKDSIWPWARVKVGTT